MIEIHSDSESDIEWDDVQLTAPVLEPSNSTGDKPSEILVPLQPKKLLTKTTGRRGISTAEKQQRLTIHKLHILCLLSHLLILNRALNTEELLANSLGNIGLPDRKDLHPQKDLIPAQRSVYFNRGLRSLIDLWRNKFKTTCEGIRKPLWRSTSANIDIFKSSRETLTQSFSSLSGSRDIGAQLLTMLLRAAGVETRLVCSLQVLDIISTEESVVPHSVPFQNPEQGLRSSANDLTSDDNEPKQSTLQPRSRRQKFRVPLNNGSNIEIINTFHDPPFPVYWSEVFDVATQKWLPVDAFATNTIAKPTKLEPPQSLRELHMCYVIALDYDGFVKDVTRRYTRSFNNKIRKSRITSIESGRNWFCYAMAFLKRQWIVDSDQIEDAELLNYELSEKMPTSVQDLKDHPMYAMERHLRRDQLIAPGSRPCGSITVGRGRTPENVYQRQSILTVKSEERWYREGRQIKNGELPVKSLPRKSRERDNRAPETAVHMYTFDQTELYVPPPVVNGRIPRNTYGNCDYYMPWMIPLGGIFVQDAATARAAANLLIVDYADAITGFRFQGRLARPIISGIIVAAEYLEAVLAVQQGFVDLALEERVQAQRKKTLERWKLFLTGLAICKRHLGLIAALSRCHVSQVLPANATILIPLCCLRAPLPAAAASHRPVFAYLRAHTYAALSLLYLRNPTSPILASVKSPPPSSSRWVFHPADLSLISLHIVAEVFSSVASSYDLMNDAMSAGIHRLWKDRFVQKLDPGRGRMNILDVAGGTGDIAFRMLDHAAKVHNDHDTLVTCVDINPDMLAEGKKRLLSTCYANTPRVSFKVQNAELLDEIPSNSVDLYTIAFGIRNCTHIPLVLQQAHRVLKPGGIFACLEFGKVSPPPLASLYRQYSFSVIPLIGQLIAGDRDSYQYLVESIEKFPKQEDFAKLIEDAGFEISGNGWEDLTFGVAAIHTGLKKKYK
ncbi:2-methoxy-6-polyprenyl-1,4-benzoquinol methylase, mitochondrial [Neolecta irregularis DAH-3]|uniref:2-methoxy-6-polyprenyl-1,4-benzoquinol methylase, mitochondrial n=1 Tax=Neolecta irregularis (strain DAH-3) TaxID=1198029 RepID=A0A1U7LVU9_NEOID|nr:2-methoxy-6-polyprenyl-1,4-benzoquinol methylase, mitochondrial [Neolecta irregularis DAH-3]|eukprot:OLL26749.1 2-methoxy-6-polyprenyl-1,4-benzoquinol methylase, mitochondrial [Neolecta irregularis DAH-3]